MQTHVPPIRATSWRVADKESPEALPSDASHPIADLHGRRNALRSRLVPRAASTPAQKLLSAARSAASRRADLRVHWLTPRSKLNILQVGIPSEFLAMAPYLVTLFIVAGAAAGVGPPPVDGKPYLKE